MYANKRILIVDDEPTVRESCQRIFTQSGYEVETAPAGKEGLDRTRQGYFDCVLVDLKLPDMDGMEIVRRIRADRVHAAVLIITGYGTVESAAEATRLGASDYVCKPFTPEEIVQAVDKAMARPHYAGPAESIAQQLKDVAPNPEHFEHRTPQAVAQMVAKAVSVNKGAASLLNTLVLGLLAGAYIGFGAALATLVGHDAASRVGVGIAQLLVGSAFSLGLILVVIAGAELFTGNNLMISGVLERQLGTARMLSRWSQVYLANFVGAVLLAYILYHAGIWKMADGAVGEKAMAIASAKIKLSFGEAFFRGVGCNWLVCLAVWMAFSAKDIAGKVMVIFFPIMSFVALGFEHCIANMYFIPMGLFLKGSATSASMNLDVLTWGNFLVRNLLPVTLGNIAGGAIFVGSVYWLVYVRKQAKKV
ncbi:MAG: formate/nitrite transporter family protein [Planctomycetes bacterium]|nr:formate/nitrite transporter family protein [Planctomycetota bacterium]